MMLATPVDAALSYAGRGWAVFPVHSWVDGRCTCGAECSSPAKHPHTANGLKDATVDAAQISAWWSRWPDANVAVATGEVSGLVVVDVDGGAGEGSLSGLEEQHGKLPRTVRAFTGGDGLHFLFAHPGERVRNSASKKLGQGLDVRGDGGYIVVAPSAHRSGQHYEWLDYETELAPMPAWLLELVREKAPTRAVAAPALPRQYDHGGTPYGLEAATRELDELARAREGGRNDQLNVATYSLAQLVAGGELDEGFVLSELFRVGMQIGLGEHEVRQTIDSGMAAGKADPRSAPPPAPPGGRSGGGGGSDGDAEGISEPSRPSLYETGDLYMARQLVRVHGNVIRFVPDWGTWLVWDSKRWKRDRTGEIFRRTKSVIGEVAILAHSIGGKQGEALVKLAMRSQNMPRIEAIVRCAQSEPGVSIEAEALDADPWLLNVLNGTLDLRTGKLREFRQSDHLTKLSPATWDPEATCPVFDGFFDRIMAGDAELKAFVQRAVGYSLTGSVEEQVMFFMHGGGANGKSKFLGAMKAVLGKEYSGEAPPDLLMVRRNEEHPTELADLQGLRMVLAVETEQHRQIKEARVKTLTGGEDVKARFMRENYFVYTPTMKLWLASNHKPQVRGTDHAMWRRIRLIPFTVTIPPGEQDKGLDAKLAAERAGILRWAVAGCLEWQRLGLAEPEAVAAATRAYRNEEDTLGRFLDDSLVLGGELSIAAVDLRDLYTKWCELNGEKPLSQKLVGAMLRDRGLEPRKVGRAKQSFWFGIGLPSLLAEEAIAGPDRAAGEWEDRL